MRLQTLRFGIAQARELGMARAEHRTDPLGHQRMDLPGVRPWRRHGQQGGVDAAQCRVGNGIAGGEVELGMRQLEPKPVQAWTRPAPAVRWEERTLGTEWDTQVRSRRVTYT